MKAPVTSETVRKYILAPNAKSSGGMSMQPWRGEPGVMVWVLLEDIEEFLKPAPQADCPHASPHRYCSECVVDPCPIGLGKKP